MTGDRASALDVVHDFVGGGRSHVDALRQLADLAVHDTGADMAGVTIVTSWGRPKTAVHTDDVVLALDEAQYAAGRGPCIEACGAGEPVVVPDARVCGERWPEFSDAAAHHAIRSTVGVPLVVAGHGIGALNLYSRDGELDATAAASAVPFARTCAIVAAFFDRAEEAENLQVAMASRAQIEQAKGVIMATTGCDADGAFDVLRQQSQTENRKLAQIAAELVSRQRRST